MKGALPWQIATVTDIRAETPTVSVPHQSGASRDAETCARRRAAVTAHRELGAWRFPLAGYRARMFGMRCADSSSGRAR